MRSYQKSANPFYILLVIAGITFALTSTVYGVMVFRQSTPPRTAAEAASQAAEHPLLEWMDRNGNITLMAELSALAIFTVGAIATDTYWQSRAEASRKT